MNFIEYQEKALTTCTPECFTEAYLHYGLISEIGELAGKLAKQIRGDDVPGEAIMGELGDIAWMIVVRAELKDESLEQVRGLAWSRVPIEELLRCVLDESESSAMLVGWIRICQGLEYDVDKVLEYNIKKLSSRQKRGEIQGDGDFR